MSWRKYMRVKEKGIGVEEVIGSDNLKLKGSSKALTSKSSSSNKKVEDDEESKRESSKSEEIE